MKNIVGLKEFRLNIDKYSSRVSKGETLVVFKRSQPLFKVVPISEDETWETVIDFTEINKSGVPIEKIIKAIGNGQAAKSSRKVTKKFKTTFEFIMLRLLARDFVGLKVTRLKGHRDVYRVKHGDLRVIFRMDSRQLMVLQVGLRSEKTYKSF